jgi:fermentation-respiration switch protein FrsA (DUF1100 family)
MPAGNRAPDPYSVSTATAARDVSIGHAGVWGRRLVVWLLLASGLLMLVYVALSVALATVLVYAPPKPITKTPATLGLDYRDVAFAAHEDGLQLRGWLIPGVLPGGRLTVDRTLIVVHGHGQNRVDTGAGVLELSADLARHGFAVLAFDMRGCGESAPAPDSFGYFEQRDVLGAVDFLRSGPPPYPELGHPRIIGGWGVSMGAATLLLAAAREPAIAAVVADSAYADILPVLEREIPKQARVPALLTPGSLLAARALYGVDYYAVRPLNAVARLAPRPVFFIHGDADPYIPPSNFAALVKAAAAAPRASVRSWLVPHVTSHAQAYHVAGQDYVSRVVAFYTSALGPDRSAP